VIVLGVGIFYLGVVATISATITKYMYPRIPIAAQPLGWIGYFLFPVPFILFWFLFLKPA
jgi:hypothetical protein